MDLSHNIENIFKFFDTIKKPDERNIEKVILNISESHKASDYKLLYILLKDKEIFIPVNFASMTDKSYLNLKYDPDDNEDVKFESIFGPNDQLLVPAATTNHCALLSRGYINIKWIDFLEIILNIEDAEGAFLEGESAWVRLEKSRISSILNFYKSH